MIIHPSWVIRVSKCESTLHHKFPTLTVLIPWLFLANKKRSCLDFGKTLDLVLSPWFQPLLDEAGNSSLLKSHGAHACGAKHSISQWAAASCYLWMGAQTKKYKCKNMQAMVAKLNTRFSKNHFSFPFARNWQSFRSIIQNWRYKKNKYSRSFKRRLKSWKVKPKVAQCTFTSLKA